MSRILAPVLRNGFLFPILGPYPTWDGETFFDDPTYGLLPSATGVSPVPYTAFGDVVGPGTSYPLGYDSIDGVARLLWRVRKLTLSGTGFRAYDPLDPPPLPDLQDIAPVETERTYFVPPASVAPHASERDLLSKPSYLSVVGVAASPYFFVTFDLHNAIAKGDDGKFYPLIRATAFSDSVAALKRFAAPEWEAVDATLEFDGRAIPLYGAPEFVFEGDLTVAPSEFWTYDGRYDADTGLPV